MKIKIGKKSIIKFVKIACTRFRYALNCKKIVKLSGSPEISFEGMEQTINWYLENKRFFKKFQKKTMKRDC